MYQTPVSDGTTSPAPVPPPGALRRAVVRRRLLGVRHEGGAASYAERMDAATSHPPPHARASGTQRHTSPANMFPVLAGILAAVVVLSLIVQSHAHIILVVFICAYGGVFCYWMRAKILRKDTGNDEMRAPDPIRGG